MLYVIYSISYIVTDRIPFILLFVDLAEFLCSLALNTHTHIFRCISVICADILLHEFIQNWMRRAGFPVLYFRFNTLVVWKFSVPVCARLSVMLAFRAINSQRFCNEIRFRNIPTVVLLFGTSIWNALQTDICMTFRFTMLPKKTIKEFNQFAREFRIQRILLEHVNFQQYLVFYQ